MTELRLSPSGDPLEGEAGDVIVCDGGTEWHPAPGTSVGAVSSVFSRVGDVAAVDGDYSASQITNDSTKPGATVADALEQLLPDPTPAGRILVANGTEWETYAGSEPGQILRWNGTIWIAGTAGVGEIQPFENEAGCVGLWKLNGTLAATVGPALTTSFGTTVFSDIVPGKPAFYFNGSTRLRVAAFDSSLALVGDMTGLCIYQLDNDPTGNTFFFGHGGSGETQSANILYSLGCTTATAPRPMQYLSEHGAGINDAYNTVAPASLPPIHNVFLLGFSRISNVITFYLNGVPFGVPSTALTTPDGGGSGFFYVGSSDGTTSMSAALCWGVKILNFGMTAAQHKAQYNSTLGQGFGLLP